jgi:DNA-binding transcriptional regulator YiaG
MSKTAFAYRAPRALYGTASEATKSQKTRADAECRSDLAQDTPREPQISPEEVKRRALICAAFKARLIANDLSAPRFAAMTHTNERTIQTWCSDVLPHDWANAWLDMYEAVPEARAWYEERHPKVKGKPRGKPFRKN